MLHWASSVVRSAAASSSRHQTRAKKPRSSTHRSRSITKASGRSVSVNRIVRVVSCTPPQIDVERAELEEVAQLADAHVTPTFEFVLGQPELAIRVDELANAGNGIPLECD